MQSTRQQPDLNVCELIRTVFARYANKKKTFITQFHILKTLFLAKKKLSDDNPLKTKLAFYWYMYGPYSQVFIDNFRHMENQSLITKNRNNYKFSSERLRVPIVPHNESIKEVIDAITPIVEDTWHTNDIRKNVYEGAPYSWYRDYNDFLDRFENYCSYFLNSDKENVTGRYTSMDIIKLLRQTIITVPDETEFRKFSLVYNAFSQMLMPLLEAGKPHEHKIAYEKLLSLSEDIWNVFASIVRVLHHDPYYEKDIPKWEEEYQNKLRELENDINDAEDALEIPESIEEFDEETLKKINLPVNPANVYTPTELLKEIDENINS